MLCRPERPGSRRCPPGDDRLPVQVQRSRGSDSFGDSAHLLAGWWACGSRPGGSCLAGGRVDAVARDPDRHGSGRCAWVDGDRRGTGCRSSSLWNLAGQRCLSRCAPLLRRGHEFVLPRLAGFEGGVQEVKAVGVAPVTRPLAHQVHVKKRHGVTGYLPPDHAGDGDRWLSYLHRRVIHFECRARLRCVTRKPGVTGPIRPVTAPALSARRLVP